MTKMTEFTALTYNLLHDVPAFRHVERRLDLLAAEIAAERPHVVALQEVSRSTASGDVGTALCARVNSRCGGIAYRLEYARADGVGDGDFAFEEGLALMSRLEPGSATKVVKFPSQVQLAGGIGEHRYRLPDDRIAILSHYRLSERTELEVCVTHLTDCVELIDGVPIRHRQARELIEWLGRVRNPSLPLLVAGDFNDVPNSETVGAIIGAGFVDLWQAAGQGDGFTNDRNDIELESPHAAPNQRIDYLFFAPGREQGFEIAEARLFMDRPRPTAGGGWLWCSDHIGVMATLRL